MSRKYLIVVFTIIETESRNTESSRTHNKLVTKQRNNIHISPVLIRFLMIQRCLVLLC